MLLPSTFWWRFGWRSRYIEGCSPRSIARQERSLSRSVYRALVCRTAAERLPSLGDGEPAPQGNQDVLASHRTVTEKQIIAS